VNRFPLSVAKGFPDKLGYYDRVGQVPSSLGVSLWS